MHDRPYTLLSCSVSMDGYIASAASRLLLSNEADFDRVDAVRASCDAILVGASTVRKDNPRLNVRDPARIAMRMASGQSPTPVKVTVTSRGDLDPKARFFTTGDCEKLVYCTYEAFPATRRRLGSVATVILSSNRSHSALASAISLSVHAGACCRAGGRGAGGLASAG